MIDFSQALLFLKDGVKVARSGWNDKGMWVHMQVPDNYSKMTQPYAYMRTARGDLIPWLPSQADIFATDWVVLP